MNTTYSDFLTNVARDMETVHSIWAMDKKSINNSYPSDYQDLSAKSLALAKEFYRFSGKNVLDIGCNSGLYSYLMGHQGSSVTACDISNELLSRAEASRSYFANLFDCTNVSFYQGNFADKLDGKVNAILACCVLYHIGDTNLRKLQDYLKENDCLIMIQARPQRGEAFIKHPEWGAVSHTKLYNGIYTLEDNINFLRDSGYERIEIVGLQSTAFFSEYFPIIIAEK